MESRTRRQPIPVGIPAEDDGKGPEPVYSWVKLPPKTTVIVEADPGDRWDNRRNNRPGLPDHLDEVIIEPHGRRARKSKVLQARWTSDATRMVTIYHGEPKRRCPKCQLEQRWVYRMRRHLKDYPIQGCSNHTWKEEVEQPRPNRGKVFAVFSGDKLQGLAPGTHIIAPVEGTWVRAIVGEYPYWTEQLPETQAKRRAEQKAEALRRWRMKLPTAFERLELGLFD